MLERVKILKSWLLKNVKYSAEGYQQEVGEVDDGDDTEEELEPLINGNDESREENEPDDSKVKFVTQDQEPVESRLKWVINLFYYNNFYGA